MPRVSWVWCRFPGIKDWHHQSFPGDFRTWKGRLLMFRMQTPVLATCSQLLWKEAQPCKVRSIIQTINQVYESHDWWDYIKTLSVKCMTAMDEITFVSGKQVEADWFHLSRNTEYWYWRNCLWSDSESQKDSNLWNTHNSLKVLGNGNEATQRGQIFWRIWRISHFFSACYHH